jgi:hypothetical protein
MKKFRRLLLGGLAVCAIWVTPVWAQEPFKTLFAEGYQFLLSKEDSYIAKVPARQPIQGSAFHTLFGEGYAALEQDEQASPVPKVAPSEIETAATTPFRAIFGEGYDFAGLRN